MYYHKESKSVDNDYYNIYSDQRDEEGFRTDILSIIIKILAIIFLLTLIIFGYIFVSNQYYLSHQSKIEQSEKSQKAKNIESVINSIHKDNEELSSQDISKIVQMVMLKMDKINANEKRVEKKVEEKPQRVERVASKTPSPTDTKVIISEADKRLDNVQFIVVKKGDTLSTIAYRVYGDRNSYQKIRDANPEIIEDTNKIFAGQRLRIPL